MLLLSKATNPSSPSLLLSFLLGIFSWFVLGPCNGKFLGAVLLWNRQMHWDMSWTLGFELFGRRVLSFSFLTCTSSLLFRLRLEFGFLLDVTRKAVLWCCCHKGLGMISFLFHLMEPILFFNAPTLKEKKVYVNYPKYGKNIIWIISLSLLISLIITRRNEDLKNQILVLILFFFLGPARMLAGKNKSRLKMISIGWWQL